MVGKKMEEEERVKGPIFKGSCPDFCAILTVVG